MSVLTVLYRVVKREEVKTRDGVVMERNFQCQWNDCYILIITNTSFIHLFIYYFPSSPPRHRHRWAVQGLPLRPQREGVRPLLRAILRDLGQPVVSESVRCVALSGGRGAGGPLLLPRRDIRLFLSSCLPLLIKHRYNISAIRSSISR